MKDVVLREEKSLRLVISNHDKFQGRIKGLERYIEAARLVMGKKLKASHMY